MYVCVCVGGGVGGRVVVSAGWRAFARGNNACNSAVKPSSAPMIIAGWQVLSIHTHTFSRSTYCLTEGGNTCLSLDVDDKSRRVKARNFGGVNRQDDDPSVWTRFTTTATDGTFSARGSPRAWRRRSALPSAEFSSASR